MQRLRSQPTLRALLGFLTMTVGLVGCGGSAPKADPIRLAAASDLRQALPILIAAFRQERPIEVDFTAGSSGQLAEQIRQGAPFDLFLSANREFVDRLATEGQVDPASVQPYAQGILVLAINPIFNIHPKRLSDLTDPKLKSIAIANTELAPYGIAAKQALESVGLWKLLQPKLVPAESVHQALQFVRSGNAEVGFVSRALTDTPGLELIAMPPDSHSPIIQTLGVLTGSKRQADARAFAAFLTGPVGQGMLKDLGFDPLPPATSAKPLEPPLPAAR